MSACPSSEQLRAFLEERLEGDALANVSTHVATCPACQQKLDQFSTDPQTEAWQRLLRDEPGPPTNPEPLTSGATTNAGAESRDSGIFWAHVQKSLQKQLSVHPHRLTRFDGPKSDDLNPLDTKVSIDDSAVTEKAPTQVGPYHILRLLGRGGMGVVYLAHDPRLHRQVALKLLPSPADGRQRRDRWERFQQEAQAAAQLHHPNIVQVFEVGEHEGQPYIALEYVPGPTLEQLTRGQALSPMRAAAKIRLLAEAIHTAHQKGIIHRDLKPANILMRVTDSRWTAESAAGFKSPSSRRQLPTATPKITDFGLAKRLNVKANLTLDGHLAGTLCYMAPEQMEEGRPLSPATDIYALGVILYELLTGTVPFHHAEPMLLVQQVLTQDPLPPRQLQADLPRDLETICLKCLAKEPQRRYVSAIALADDLRRFIDGRPVLARRTGWLEGGWKWARRRPAVAALVGMLVVVVLGAFLGMTALYVLAQAAREEVELNERAARTAQADAQINAASAEQRRQEAERDRLRVRQMLEDMTSELAEEWLTSRQELSPGQKHFLDNAVRYYREFLQEATADAESRLRVGRGSLQLGSLLSRLGRDAEAEEAFRQAITLFDQSVVDYPTSPGPRLSLANAHNSLGGLFNGGGRLKEAEDEYRRALSILEALTAMVASGTIGANPAGEIGVSAGAAGLDNMALIDRDFAGVLSNLAALMSHRGHSAEALKLLEQAVQRQLAALAKMPKDTTARHYLIQHYLSQGIVLGNLSRLSDAATAFQQAIPLAEELVNEQPGRSQFRSDLARAYGNLGTCQLNLGRLAEAEPNLRQAQTLLSRLSADFPAVPVYAELLAANRSNYALTLSKLNRPAEAEAAFRDALAVLEQLSANDRGASKYVEQVVKTGSTYAAMLTSLDRSADAEALFRKSIAFQEKLVADHPNIPSGRLLLGRLHNDLSMVLLHLQRREEAMATLKKAIGIFEPLSAEFPDLSEVAIEVAGSYVNLGVMLRDASQSDAALAWFDKAQRALEKVLAKSPAPAKARLFLRNACANRAMTLENLQRCADAAKEWQAAIDLTEGAQRDLFQPRQSLALAHAGDCKQAVAQADALSHAEKLPGESWLVLARVYAIAMAAERSDVKAADANAAAAIECLHKACAQGFFKAKTNLEQFRRESDFESLRSRADFQQLLPELEKE